MCVALKSYMWLKQLSVHVMKCFPFGSFLVLGLPHLSHLFVCVCVSKSLQREGDWCVSESGIWHNDAVLLLLDDLTHMDSRVVLFIARKSHTTVTLCPHYQSWMHIYIFCLVLFQKSTLYWKKSSFFPSNHSNVLFFLRIVRFIFIHVNAHARAQLNSPHTVSYFLHNLSFL